MSSRAALAARLGACAAIALFACDAPVHAGQQSFALPVHHRHTWQSDATVGDVNGDGLDDIASIGEGTGKVNLHIQQSNGSLGPSQALTHPRVAHGLAIVDLGKGGPPVLVIGDAAGFSLYRWNGNGHDVVHHPGPVHCYQVVPADVDQDGNVDLFCNGPFAGAALSFGLDGGGFAAPVELELPAGRGSFALFDDVNKDGLPDLLLSDQGSNSFFVLDNDGDRGFMPAVAYPYEANLTWSASLAVGDVDGDGSKEVYAARPCNFPCAKVLVFRRDAKGFFSLSQELETFDIPSLLKVDDIDKDGRLDLIVSHPGWSTLGRYMGRDGGLWPYEFHSMAPRGGYDLGDVNGDGQVDAVFSSSMGISVLYGGRKQATDFNGDLVSDLVWRHASGRNVVWLAADSSLVMEMPSMDPVWSLDAYLYSPSVASATAFWRNTESGANELWSPHRLSTDAMVGVSDTDWKVVGTGDFDGDDAPDLLWRHAKTGANAIWLEGDGTRRRHIARVADVSWRVVGVGDFDGDGLSDIVWRHASTGRLVAWPRGDKASQRSLATVSNLSWGVVGVGDFDRDGQDDLMWRQRQTGQNVIWRSADILRPQAVRRVVDIDWSVAAIGDYDGDGRSDLLWRHVSGRNVVWYRADYRLEQVLTKVDNADWRIVAP